MPNSCIVPGCKNNSEINWDVEFFRIPSGKSSKGVPDPQILKRRQCWIEALQIDDSDQHTLKNGRICSDHFLIGQPIRFEQVDHPDWGIPTISHPEPEPDIIPSNLEPELTNKECEEFNPVSIASYRLKHEPNKRNAVCSCHFKDGSKQNLPEYFLRNINIHFDCFPVVETPKRLKFRIFKPTETSNIPQIRDLLSRVDKKPKPTKKRASPRIVFKELEPVIDLDLSDLVVESKVEVFVPKSLTTCGINTCAHSSENSKCEWIKMPQVDKLRNQWIEQIGKFGDKLRSNSLICTCHFEDENDRMRGPTIFYANVDVSYNNDELNKIKQSDSDIDEEPHTEKVQVQVADFVDSPSHKQDDTLETTLIQMLNSTPEQITASLNLDTNLKLYNFKKTCRICLNNSPSRNIYEDHIEDITIVDMLQQVTCSQISETDKLPKLVCTNCVQQIFYAYTFLKKFVSSNKKLVEYVNFCEEHVNTITDLQHSIHVDHCYDSFRNPQLAEPEYVNPDLCDGEILETDPLAMESSLSPDFEHEPNARYLPVIPAGFVQCYPERSNKSNMSEIPIISADFPSYLVNMADCDVDESDKNITADILVRNGIEIANTSNNIEFDVPLTISGKSLLQNEVNEVSLLRSEEFDTKIEKPIIMSAEVNQTVESFKNVLKCTSDIDDHMKVDIIDTLIELYSLKTPDYERHFDSNRIFNCKRCNKIFANRKEQKKHNCANPILRNVKIVYTNPKKRDQIESFQCRICRKKFSNLTVLVSHACFVKFTRKRMQKSEKPLSKQFTCYECSEKFDFYSELVKHREDTSHADGVVLNENPVKVNLPTTDLNEINVAIRSIDPDSEIATVEQPVEEKLKHLCTKCGQRFEFFSQLVQHNRICKPPPILTCPVCSLEMKRAKFTEHMKMHNNDWTYCCEFCGRSFKFGRHFKRHMEIHMDIKPYDCNECTKKFRQKSALKTHMLIHSGEKPYMCEGCGQKFRQRGTLTFHLKTKPCGKNLELDLAKSTYDCSVCHKQLTSKSKLIVHLKSHVYLK